MAKKKDTQVLILRNSIIGFVTVVAVLLVGFGTYVSTSLSDQAITAESDYREVERPKLRRTGDPIEVIEYFSYTCIHCKTFDPMIEDWAEALGDSVIFKRSPVMWSPTQTMLGRTYLTLADKDILADNHNRIFRAIHDARRQFLTPQMMAEYVDGRGTTKDEFIKAFNSPAMRRATADAERDIRTYGISATPSLLVGGQYVIGMDGGQQRVLDIAEHLIEKIRTAESASTEPDTAS